MYYSADSDAIITKGIIALLIRVLNGRTPQQVLDTDLYFIDRIGLRENLSPTRANGLAAMIKQMRLYALAFAAAARSEREMKKMEPNDILRVEQDIIATLSITTRKFRSMSMTWGSCTTSTICPTGRRRYR